MRHYELTFIVDPVLSNEEIQTVRQTYEDHIKKQGCKIIHVDDLGLKQLAYPLNKRNSGIYFSIEFEAEIDGDRSSIAQETLGRLPRPLQLNRALREIHHGRPHRAGCTESEHEPRPMILAITGLAGSSRFHAASETRSSRLSRRAIVRSRPRDRSARTRRLVSRM